MRTTELSRTETLKKINDILEAYGMPHWDEGKLGDVTEGKCEIIDMVDVAEITDERIEITMRMLTPSGSEADIRIRIGGTVYYVIPYLTVTQKNLTSQNYVGMVKRWRVEHGSWSYELPHNLVFPERHSPAMDAFESPAHEVLRRTFGDECLTSLSAAKVMPMGELTLKWENRKCESYMMVANVNKPFERKKGDGELVLLDWRTILGLIDKDEYITDLGTIAVLLKASRRFKHLAEAKK